MIPPYKKNFLPLAKKWLPLKKFFFFTPPQKIIPPPKKNFVYPSPKMIPP